MASGEKLYFVSKYLSVTNIALYRGEKTVYFTKLIIFLKTAEKMEDIFFYMLFPCHRKIEKEREREREKRERHVLW